MKKFQHIRIVEGEYVRKRKSTLYDAATELADHLCGRVAFTCPNYAVVVVGWDEYNVWMK